MNQLLEICNTIISNLVDEGKDVRFIFCHIYVSKAFDKVSWHKGLLYKLKQNGIYGNILYLYFEILKYGDVYKYWITVHRNRAIY